MNFNDITYKRPDYESAKKLINDYATKISTAIDFETLCTTIHAFQLFIEQLATTSIVALIRCYLDSSNEFYANEMTYCESQFALLDFMPLYDAMLKSPFHQQLNEKYGETLLLQIKNNVTISKGGGALRAQEVSLIGQYQQLKATLEFEYEGKTLREVELPPLRNHPDRQVRKEARKALVIGYNKHKEAFESILNQLIQIRTNLAKTNGFQNYLDFINIEKGRYSYGEAELTNFCQLVKQELVPLRIRLHEILKERLGLTDYTCLDTKIYFKEGNPKPAGDDQFLLHMSRKMYKDLDTELASLLERMIAEDYIHCSSSKNKISGMGFATQIFSEKIPFIFGNCNGSKDDVNVFIHEFGHAFQMQKSMETHSLMDYWDMPTDMAEIPSKVMEQLSYDYADLFFQDKGPAYVAAHMMGVLEEICDFLTVHEFETFLYNNPTAPMTEIIQKHNEINKSYRPAVDDTPLEDVYAEGGLLFSDMGVYMFPRYLVSYSLSDITAISFRILFDQNKEEGLARYKQLCTIGGSLDYNNAMNTLGLPPAYTKEAILSAKAYFEQKLSLI